MDKSANNYAPVGSADQTHGWGYNPRANFNPLQAYQDANGNYTQGSLGLGTGLPFVGNLVGAKGNPIKAVKSFGKGFGRAAAKSVSREALGYGQSAIRDMAGGLLGRAGVEAYQDKGLARAQQATADRWRQNVGQFSDWVPAGSIISSIADSAGYIKGGLDHYNISAGEVGDAAWRGAKNLGESTVNFLGDVTGVNSLIDTANEKDRLEAADQRSRDSYKRMQGASGRSIGEQIMGVGGNQWKGISYEDNFLNGGTKGRITPLKSFAKSPSHQAQKLVTQTTPSAPKNVNAPVNTNVNKPVA